jgi:hypothetical protein
MATYIAKVGFSGYFFHAYEVTASTEEEARVLLETAITEDGWQEADTAENIVSLSTDCMEITDWDINDIEEDREE